MPAIFLSHASRDNTVTDEIDARLSKMGFQSIFLDYDRERGIPVGADWEQILYARIDRSDAVIVVLSPNWVASKWCFVEFAQARALGKTILPVIIDEVADDAIPRDIQRLDLRHGNEAYEQLERVLKALAFNTRGGLPWDGTRAPYPGMLAFQEADAAVYFGRDPEARKLVERLNALRIRGSDKVMAVLGSSGSGKSSLLRAGVLPRMRTDKKNWILVDPLRPGTRPSRALFATLASHLDHPTWLSEIDIIDEGRTVALAQKIIKELRIAHRAPEAQLLVPVDQGEEVFSIADRADARTFETLVAALSEAGNQCTILFAMRSEFLGTMQRSPALSDRIEEFSLGPMPLARVSDIITKPAGISNLKVDDALVDKLREDAETEDALPLIAFTLREMYDRLGDSHYLRLADYQALGSDEAGRSALENVVRVAAEELIDRERPAPSELVALREAFIPHLVNLTESGDLTRRGADWNALPADAQRMLQNFVDARLLVSSADADGTRRLEISHEALLRTWPRLQTWAEKDKQFLIWSRDTLRSAQSWKDVSPSQRKTALLSGWEIDYAVGMLSAHGDRIGREVRRYVEKSFFRRFYARLALAIAGALLLSPTVADTLEVLISIAVGRLDWSRSVGLEGLVTQLDILGKFQLGLQAALVILLVALLVKRRRVTQGHSETVGAASQDSSS